MKITDLKKQLNSMEKNELTALVCKLYKASKQAQSLVDIKLCGESVEEQLVTEYKKIHQALYQYLMDFMANPAHYDTRDGCTRLGN